MTPHPKHDLRRFIDALESQETEHLEEKGAKRLKQAAAALDAAAEREIAKGERRIAKQKENLKIKQAAGALEAVWPAVNNLKIVYKDLVTSLEHADLESLDSQGFDAKIVKATKTYRKALFEYLKEAHIKRETYDKARVAGWINLKSILKVGADALAKGGKAYGREWLKGVRDIGDALAGGSDDRTPPSKVQDGSVTSPPGKFSRTQTD